MAWFLPGRGTDPADAPVHRQLLAAVGDATAGGVEGVALGCLNAFEAGEAVLELHEAMARLKGLQLALLAHADQLDVSSQADGQAPITPPPG